MSFKTFVFDEFIIANEFNDNFSWIGAGDWLPRGGAGLEPSTSIYDLGSLTYKWNNVYANSVNVDGNANIGHWNKIAETTLTATSQAIEFTGLTTDLFKIIINAQIRDLEASGVNFRLYLNNDSGTNYGQLNITGKENNTTSITVLTSRSGVNFAPAIRSGAGTIMFYNYNILLSSKFNLNKEILFEGFIVETMTSDPPYKLTHSYLGSGIHNNQNTLTSIKFIIETTTDSISTFLTNTNIQIWSPIS